MFLRDSRGVRLALNQDRSKIGRSGCGRKRAWTVAVMKLDLERYLSGPSMVVHPFRKVLKVTRVSNRGMRHGPIPRPVVPL